MLIFLMIAIFTLGLLAAPLLGYLLSQRRFGLIVGMLVLLLVSGGGLASYIFFSTGTFFISGITCLLFPLALIALLIALFWRRKNGDLLSSDIQVKRWYWVGVVLIPIILVLPFFEIFGITAACFGRNARTAEPIIAAMEAYHQDHGIYPEEINALSPQYLGEIPAGHCAPIGASTFEVPVYDISTCTYDGETTVLSIPIGSGEWIQRYNMDTGLWSRVSFLDGACSNLR